MTSIDAEYKQDPNRRLEMTILFDKDSDIISFIEGVSVAKGLVARFDGEFSQSSRESVCRVLTVLKGAANMART